MSSSARPPDPGPPSLESLRCSFCGLRPTDPKSIIRAGTSEIAICSTCIELCTEMLAEQHTGAQAPDDQPR